ncbi:MAG: sigma-70 family RNA polymerase sigma factor [Verrucomicrobia bacterium]|nr:sigma-70 family RNA polymerase sigma factor [Verrucomicrobiota bacterium]
MPSDSSHSSLFSAEKLFPNTPWSLIRDSHDEGNPRAMAALDRLAHAYWRPLYACTRAMGFPHSQAEDEVQKMFEKLLSLETLRTVAPEQTRFRYFLLACLKNSVYSSRRRDMTAKRGNGLVPDRLEDSPEAIDMQSDCLNASPELAMDRAWAQEVFERAFTLLEEDAVKRGRQAQFAIVLPLLRGASPDSGYAGLAARLEVSEGTARKMVFDLRARLGMLIRRQVEATVVDPAEVDEELRHLLSLI